MPNPITPLTQANVDRVVDLLFGGGEEERRRGENDIHDF